MATFKGRFASNDERLLVMASPREVRDGLRLGNWLALEQFQRPWYALDTDRLKAKSDRASADPSCSPAASGEAKRWIWQREEHWTIIDLKGKAGHIRNNSGAWMGSPLDTFEPPPF